MSREARANLIFLGLFLLISAPGVAMLVKKKMEAGRAPAWLPVPARQSVVYMDPIDAPPTLRRLTPALTASWVADLTRLRIGPTTLPSRSGADGAPEPVMSEQRLAQLLAFEPAAQYPRLALLLWNLPRDAQAAQISLRLQHDSQVIVLQNVTTESIELPPAVKRDLQDSGIPAPPLRVWWVCADLPQGVGASAMQLRIDCQVDGALISDTLWLGVR
ncbi:MAG: hypothetical protein NZ561_07635 [Phycisphaerae bacterium]|nr:hypothetical protein [Phycisphaerae bacterium]MDW8261640.1 hypothetical protein [Phycisphaerales bacterium]